MHAVFDYSHSKDSLVSVPDFEFVPLAETNPHKYFLWALLRSVSDQSLFSILVIPSKLVAPTTYISLAIVFFMFARLNCANSMFARVISAFSKSVPSRVASKKEAE